MTPAYSYNDGLAEGLRQGQQENERLRAERDDLLTLLKETDDNLFGLVGSHPVRQRIRKALARASEQKAPVISDCGEDGCGECDVCRYLDHLEHARACAPPGESTIERSDEIEKHLDVHYPHWRR